jgi:hypothetical protein
VAVIYMLQRSNSATCEVSFANATGSIPPLPPALLRRSLCDTIVALKLHLPRSRFQ